MTGLHKLGVWGFSERSGLRAPQGREGDEESAGWDVALAWSGG